MQACKSFMRIGEITRQTMQLLCSLNQLPNHSQTAFTRTDRETVSGMTRWKIWSGQDVPWNVSRIANRFLFSFFLFLLALGVSVRVSERRRRRRVGGRREENRREEKDWLGLLRANRVSRSTIIIVQKEWEDGYETNYPSLALNSLLALEKTTCWVSKARSIAS